jgi:hypothetical protein
MLSVLGNENLQLQYHATNKKILGEKNRYYIYSRDGRIADVNANQTCLVFKIDAMGDQFLEKLRLVNEIQFSVDENATAPRYKNAMPIFQYEKIEIYQNNNLIQTITSDEMYELIKLHTPQDDLVYTFKHYGIGDNTFRTVQDGDKIKFFTDFSDFFNMFNKPFPIFKLKDNGLEFKIYYGSKMLTEDAKVTYDYTQTYMLATYVKPYSQQLINYYKNLSSFSFIELTPYSTFITPQTTTKNQTHILSYLHGRNCAYLSIKYITDANYDAGNRTSFETISEFSLTDSGRNLDGNNNFKFTDKMFREVILYDCDIENKDDLYNDNIYFINYCNSMKKVFTTDDSLLDNFKVFIEKQPQLEITFSANPSASKILITNWAYEIISISGGRLKRQQSE